MSTNTVKSATRPVKPKAAPKAAVAPTADNAAPVVALTTETEKAKRQQIGKLIDLDISHARVRRWVDKLILNKSVEAVSAELHQLLAPYEEASNLLKAGARVTKEEVTKEDGTKETVEKSTPLTDDEKAQFGERMKQLENLASVYEAKLTALSRERVRFSNEAAVALAIILDRLVQQLISHSMVKVLAVEKKIVQIEHMHKEGIETLSLFPLIKTLPSFTATAKKLADEEQSTKLEKLIAKECEKAVKEFKQKNKDALAAAKKKKAAAAQQAPAAPQPVAQPAPQPAAAQPVAEVAADTESDDETEDPEGKVSFKFYVQSVCKRVIKSNEKYKSVRISTDIRNYLSDLLIELIHRLAPLILHTTELMKIKTVNGAAILGAVKGLLIDGHSPVETITFTEEKVPDTNAQRAEAARKEEAKKSGQEYKAEPIPLVDGFVAKRSVAYSTSGYADLVDEVEKKITIFRTHATETVAKADE
jgi:hypothetical protein